MFEQLNQMKAQLDAARPLPAATTRSLHDDLLLRWTYHSNAIEGNTLTLLETKVVLEGITVGGKALREHFEAINHRDAIYYVDDIIHKQAPFSEWQIRNIHQLILKNILRKQEKKGENRLYAHLWFAGILMVTEICWIRMVII